MYKQLVFNVRFTSEEGQGIARFDLTIPEFPQIGWIIKINDVRYEVLSIEQIDYTEKTAAVFLR